MTVREQIRELENKLFATDKLNQTLLVATTAYQVRMANQELTIEDQDTYISELKDLVKEQEIFILNLKNEVGYD